MCLRYLRYEVLHGGEFIDVLGDLVDEAERRIYLASYVATLTEQTKDIYYGLLYKQRHGVDVKLLLNGQKMEYNQPTIAFLREIGLRGARLLMERYTHMKLYIVDDRFIIGSHNLTAPSENRYDVSLMIESMEAASVLSDMFLKLYNGDEILFTRLHGMLGGLEYEVQVNEAVLERVYELTEAASERIKILMYQASLTPITKAYYGILRRKWEEGLDIAVLLNGRPYNAAAYRHLKNLGVDRVLLTKRFVHAKLYVIDDFVIIGSHNLTSSSLAGRLEMAIGIKSPNMADAFDKVIEDLYLKEEQSKLLRPKFSEKFIL